MPVSFQGMIQKVRYAALLVMLLIIWALVFMVYFDSFISPFDRLQSWLVPTQNMYSLGAGISMTDRMDLMHQILESSRTVSRVSFVVMIVSFVFFSVYLTIVYQQKQRRLRENTLLQLKNEEIARRNEFIRYISATIGHEFKNNLSRIKRRLDLLTDISPETRISIDNNLENLFADIRIFKKISDEREEELTGFTKVYLRNMLSDIAEKYSDLVDTTFQPNFYPPMIYASNDLLNTVFENLFDNAIKFKKPEQAMARIMVSYTVDRDGKRPYLSLSIKDEGKGMNEMQADQCFYKGTTSNEGWGQGLYFAKYVVGLHAGKIKVGKDYTAPGIGTEIIINLPFVEE